MEKDRRLFFRQMASSAARCVRGLVAGETPEPAPRMQSDILGDLTPELLALEAQRLGLDPEKDRHRVIESIQAAMGGPENEGRPM